nr:hypothetical protein [Streptomyces sp. NWU339]
MHQGGGPGAGVGGGDAEGERGLAHGRAGGDHDHLPGHQLHQGVQIGEAGDGGRREGHGQAVQVGVQVVPEPAEVVIVGLAVGGEVLQLRLMGGDRLRHGQRVRQAGALHPAHQGGLVAAHLGVAVHEVGVVAGLGRRTGFTREAGQADHAAQALDM